MATATARAASIVTRRAAAMRTRQARALAEVARVKAKYDLPSTEELRAMRYVVPPRDGADARIDAAATRPPIRTAVFDLHETLVRLEPLEHAHHHSKGAPAGCLQGGWSVEAPTSSRRVLSGPPEAGRFVLHLRPGVERIMDVLRRHDAYEGMLWTVGGLLYVNCIIDALETLGDDVGTGRVGLQHVVMSDSPAFDEAGATCGPSDWPFLHDCKPAALLNRNPRDVLQVDDRPEYLRMSPATALVVPPFYARDGDAPDDTLHRVAEILERIAESPLPVADVLRELPPRLARPQDVGGGLTMSCVV